MGGMCCILVDRLETLKVGWTSIVDVDVIAECRRQ